MTIVQTEFSEAELLAHHDIAEPLILNGVRCHGGFLDDGQYVSPRTKNRRPAIEAWEAQRSAQFSTPLLGVPLDTWPESFPNVAQTRFLLGKGVPEPTIGALTRIGTVEGFGGMLRMIPTPDWGSCFDEPIDGTAVAHIDHGLFEAHARDEAGHGEEAGHNRMWFVARDMAFENPDVEDQTSRMMARMGISGSPAARTSASQAPAVVRELPDDIDPVLESVVSRMIGLLLIEISAFHSFAWAEEVLSDTSLVGGEGKAATIVSYIRSDETPHVAWLRTALSEMRDRTWIGTSGRRHGGGAMIGRLWDNALERSLTLRRQENLRFFMDEIDEAVEGRQDGADVIAEMLSLGSVVRLADGSLCDRAADPAGDIG